MKAALFIFWDLGRLCANASLSTQALASWFTCAVLCQKLPTGAGGFRPLNSINVHKPRQPAKRTNQIRRFIRKLRAHDHVSPASNSARRVVLAVPNISSLDRSLMNIDESSPYERRFQLYYTALHNCRESEKKKVVCTYLYQPHKHSQAIRMLTLYHAILHNLKGSEGANSSSSTTGVQCEDNMPSSWHQEVPCLSNSFTLSSPWSPLQPASTSFWAP
jgi:hypothetical protein